jgi:UDP-N-acetyl-D-mannosaminouronate:lipid I N-acetyl-D-mannosaminouronosyltransferase
MIKESTLLQDIKIYPFISVNELLDTIESEKKILVAINAEKIIFITESLKAIINNNIGYADGIGAVMALKKKGYNNVIKIPGCELWLKVIERYCSTKSFYFIGGRQEVIEQTIKKVKNKYPNIAIANYRNGYFNDDEKQALLSDLKDKKPDIVFVAMGSPKQELLMQEMLTIHPAVYQGLGGSFDVYINKVKRAPQWFIIHNLEWIYRLIKQPSRITRQIQLLKYIPFLYSLKEEKIESS